MLNKFLIKPEYGEGYIVNILNVNNILLTEHIDNPCIAFDFDEGSVGWVYENEQDRNTDLNLIMSKFGESLDEWK